MKLILRDKTTLEVADTSTKESMLMVLGSYEELDAVRPKLTAENFKGATLGEETLENYAPTGLLVSDDLMGVNIVATITAKELPLLERLTGQVQELQETVAELLEGGLE